MSHNHYKRTPVHAYRYRDGLGAEDVDQINKREPGEVGLLWGIIEQAVTDWRLIYCRTRGVRVDCRMYGHGGKMERELLDAYVRRQLNALLELIGSRMTLEDWFRAAERAVERDIQSGKEKCGMNLVVRAG